jgi:ribosomal protein S27AE
MHSILALLRSLLTGQARCSRCGAPAPLATDERRRPICGPCAAARYQRGA